jgi:hypothetical protein
MADLRYIEANKIMLKIDSRAVQEKTEVIADGKYLNGCMLYGIVIALIVACVKPDVGLVMAGGLILMQFINGASAEYEIVAAAIGDPISASGAIGELLVLDALRYLPAGYLVMNQLLVPDSHSTYGYREIDYLVLGPTGAHILEAKSYNGYVAGGEHDREWTMYKVGRRGTPYITSCRNPARQTRIYIRLLSDALQARGVRLWLNGLIVLSQDNSLDQINVTSVGVAKVSWVVRYLKDFSGLPVKNPQALAAVIRQISEETKSANPR